MYDVSAFPDAAWKRLGEAIRRRRVALGLTQQQLADKADVSVNTIRNLEQGKRARLLTLPRIDSALGWVDGCYLLVLDGGLPVVQDVPEEPDDDSLRLERPGGMSDAEWADLTEKLVYEMQFWLKRRRGD